MDVTKHGVHGRGGEHRLRKTRLDPADRVQALNLVRTEFDLQAREIFFELIQGARTDDR